MTSIHWLAVSVVFTGLLWVPYVLERIASLGLMEALGNPDPDAPRPASWAMRSAAAHRNAVENLVLFAPAVGIAVANGRESAGIVVTAAMIHVIARLAYTAVYIAGIPVLRTLTFSASLFATFGVVYGALA